MSDVIEPVSVILSVVVAVFGAPVPLVTLPFLNNNLYTQIGMVMLIGLASKNAILIVKFAKVRRDAGLPAVRLRFRAVMMTALAFILGVCQGQIAKNLSTSTNLTTVALTKINNSLLLNLINCTPAIYTKLIIHSFIFLKFGISCSTKPPPAATVPSLPAWCEPRCVRIWIRR